MATEELAPRTVTPPVHENDRMPVHGIDHVEFYVGNAAQAAYYFVHAFGFTETAYRGLETGHRGAQVARARAGAHPARADGNAERR